MDYGWSINLERWRAFGALAKDLPAEWRRVKLRPLDRDSVPQKSGIYVVCAKAAVSHLGHFDSLYNALYVGQATSLRQRFMGHCQAPSERMKRAMLCFSAGLDFWFIEAEAQLLNDLERTLIACLGPPVNIQVGVIKGVVMPPRPA